MMNFCDIFALRLRQKAYYTATQVRIHNDFEEEYSKYVAFLDGGEKDKHNLKEFADIWVELGGRVTVDELTDIYNSL